MAVFVSPRVKTELDDIWLHTATESVSIDIASRLSSQSPIISFSYRSIRTSGRRRDDLRAGLRSVTVDNDIIIYRVEGSNVRVLHVVHGRRDIKSVIRH